MTKILREWTLPSGNYCQAQLLWTTQGDDRGLTRINFGWRTPPPLSVEDEAYYLDTIVPETRACFYAWLKTELGLDASDEETTHIDVRPKGPP